jgi:hypothetical protein
MGATYREWDVRRQQEESVSVARQAWMSRSYHPDYTY